MVGVFMMGEKADSILKVRFGLNDAINIAKNNGYFTGILDDIQCDPIAAQSIWLEAKGPRSNDNKTYSQTDHDVALNYLLKEIDSQSHLATRVINQWLLLICGSWPHTENFFAEVDWKPYFALCLLGSYLKIDESLYPSIGFFEAISSQKETLKNFPRFADPYKKALDLCVAKQILLKVQTNIWRKFQGIHSKFERAEIDFTSLDKANLALLGPFIFDTMSIIGYVSDNKHQLLDIISFIDKDIYSKNIDLSDINFMFSLFAIFKELLNKIDFGFSQLILDSVL
jgi:hypothetical protein